MKKKSILAIILCMAVASNICLAATGDIIHLLDRSPMISPGSSESISLSKLSNDKFYTITADIINTNVQNVDYKITTYYAMTSYGSIGDVTTENGSLKKVNYGYVGHLTNAIQQDKITIKNVRVNNGVIQKDSIILENVTPFQPGSGIEIRNVRAIEQADSNEKIEI